MGNYHKALLFKDEKIANKILKENNTRKIKQLGREVKNFDEKIWKNQRCKIVENGNYLKFTQNKDLLNELLSTDDLHLVEASPDDDIWGIGMDEHHPNVCNPRKWLGTNLLGICIMNVRTRIRNEFKNNF